MEVIEEASARQRLLHSVAVPGLFVYGKVDEPLAMAMQEEAVRFQRAFPQLEVPSASICLVVEHLQGVRLTEPGLTASLFAADLEWPAARLRQACMLLADSVRRVESCCRSFPEPEYDYALGEAHPCWQPTSGREAMERFAGQLRAHLAVYGQPWQQTLSCAQNMEAALAALSARADFAQNRLLHTPQGDWCAGRWLRALLELCQLTGRRLYRLGVRCFGRRYVEDPFCFALTELLEK